MGDGLQILCAFCIVIKCKHTLSTNRTKLMLALALHMYIPWSWFSKSVSHTDLLIVHPHQPNRGCWSKLIRKYLSFASSIVEAQHRSCFEFHEHFPFAVVTKSCTLLPNRGITIQWRKSSRIIQAGLLSSSGKRGMLLNIRKVPRKSINNQAYVMMTC